MPAEKNITENPIGVTVDPKILDIKLNGNMLYQLFGNYVNNKPKNNAKTTDGSTDTPPPPQQKQTRNHFQNRYRAN